MKCRRITTCLYIMLRNCCADVAICMVIGKWPMLWSQTIVPDPLTENPSQWGWRWPRRYSNRCYGLQPPLLESDHLTPSRAHSVAYWPLPGQLRRSRVDNDFFISYWITRCQILTGRHGSPDWWVSAGWGTASRHTL